MQRKYLLQEQLKIIKRELGIEVMETGREREGGREGREGRREREREGGRDGGREGREGGEVNGRS